MIDHSNLCPGTRVPRHPDIATVRSKNVRYMSGLFLQLKSQILPDATRILPGHIVRFCPVTDFHENMKLFSSPDTTGQNVRVVSGQRPGSVRSFQRIKLTTTGHDRTCPGVSAPSCPGLLSRCLAGSESLLIFSCSFQRVSAFLLVSPM